MDLLDITDATMASALTTVYGRLANLAVVAEGETFENEAAADVARDKLKEASRQLARYLHGKQYLPDEDGEAEDLNDLLEYATAIGADYPTWESYIVDARDA